MGVALHGTVSFKNVIWQKMSKNEPKIFSRIFFTYWIFLIYYLLHIYIYIYWDCSFFDFWLLFVYFLVNFLGNLDVMLNEKVCLFYFICILQKYILHTFRNILMSLFLRKIYFLGTYMTYINHNFRSFWKLSLTS